MSSNIKLPATPTPTPSPTSKNIKKRIRRPMPPRNPPPNPPHIRQRSRNAFLEPIHKDNQLKISHLYNIHHTRSFTFSASPSDIDEQMYHEQKNEIIATLHDTDDEDNYFELSTMQSVPSIPLHKCTTDLSDMNTTTTIHDDIDIDLDAIHKILDEHKGFQQEDDFYDNIPSISNTTTTTFVSKSVPVVDIYNQHDNDVTDDIDRVNFFHLPLPSVSITAHQPVKHKHKLLKHKHKPITKQKKIRLITPVPGPGPVAMAVAAPVQTSMGTSGSNSLGDNYEVTKWKYTEYAHKLNYITMSGYLDKKSPTKFVGWQRRWFYLWKDTIDYYKESSLIPKGSLALADIYYVGTGDNNINKKQYTFQIMLYSKKNRTYHIRASDNNIRTKWINAINNNIHFINILSPRTNLSLTKDTRSSEYNYKRNRDKRSKSHSIFLKKQTNIGRTRSYSLNDMRLTHQDVTKYSNTGDILLFKSRNASGNFVRAATHGEYDHIGMILRLKGDKIGILEALGSGVQVFLWENFRKYKWHEQYPKVAMRSLIIPDHSIRCMVTKELAAFVKKVVNRQYGWNPLQLMRKTSILPLDDVNRTFFCSELIAKGLKEVGLLRSDFASSKYYPCHFQQNKRLKLLKGCSFSEEMLVTWNCNDNDNDLMCQPINAKNSVELKKNKKFKLKNGKNVKNGKNKFKKSKNIKNKLKSKHSKHKKNRKSCPSLVNSTTGSNNISVRLKD